jgi:disulfide oxidoreductase YuzD
MHTPQIPTRAEWKTIRDKQKVPTGAAKVSIGKTIDSFYASWNEHKLDQNLTDTRQLIANLITYVAAVRPKYPTFVASVEKIKRGAEDHKKQLEEVIRAKTLFYPRYEQITKALLQVKIKAPGAPKPKDVTALVTNLKGCIDTVAYVDPTWEERRKKAYVLNAQFEKGFKDWTTANGDDSAFQAIVKKVSELRP